MKYTQVSIAHMAHVLPPMMLTSSDIEEKLSPLYQRLKLPEGRLELMSGIKSRGMWPVGTRPSAIATLSAEKLLEENNIDRNSIDLLIFTSVCRDFLEPATAAVVHDQLNLPAQCRYFDLSNACLGMLTAMEMAASMIESGAIKNCLLVSGENSGPLLTQTIEVMNGDRSLTRQSIKKYIASLTIGSGSVSAFLTKSDLSDGPKLLASATMVDSKAQKLCQGSGDTQGLLMETDAEVLLERGIILARKTWGQTLSVLQWQNNTADIIFGHQVGRAHRDQLLAALELDVKNDYSTFERLGNSGSAALPTALSLALEDGTFKKKMKAALLGIGSGLACTMYGIEW